MISNSLSMTSGEQILNIIMLYSLIHRQLYRLKEFQIIQNMTLNK